MKLHLGAGNDIREGYVNHDLIKHRKEIDTAFDLNDYKWPLAEKSYDEILASDVIEHLNDPVNFLDNCWGMLISGGVLHLKACGWQNPNFHVDPTHKHGYDIKSFDYFVIGMELEREYGMYTSKKWRYLSGYPQYDRAKNIIVKMTPVK